MKIKDINKQYLKRVFRFIISRKGTILNWSSRYILYPIISKFSFHCGVLKQKRETPIIISFTTILGRIDKVHLCIETLFRQSLKPDYIFLWLAEEMTQTPERATILNKTQTKALKRLKKLKRRGLEIKFCKDIGPYKKSIYTLKNYPDAILVTVDDDIFYRRDFLKELYTAYQKEPQYIHCHRARFMQKNADGKFKKYKDWKLFLSVSLHPSLLVFPTGSGGCFISAKYTPTRSF